MECDTDMDVTQSGAILPYFDKSNAARNTIGASIFIAEIEEIKVYATRRKYIQFTSISFEHTAHAFL